MNEELRARVQATIAINPKGKVRDKLQASIGTGAIVKDIGEALNTQLIATEKNKLESIPRETVLKMLINSKIDEHFIFKVVRNEGENYIQAMRQVLSRTRKKALKKKQRLDEFKMLVVNVESKEDHDVVTLVRTKNMTAHEASVYDNLIDAFKKV